MEGGRKELLLEAMFETMIMDEFSKMEVQTQRGKKMRLSAFLVPKWVIPTIGYVRKCTEQGMAGHERDLPGV